MRKTKRILTFLLALVLCMSLTACGGREEETTAPAADDPMLAIEETIFSDPKMDGVEHIGLYINADTASEEQVAYAMAYLNVLAHTPIEGYEYLYKSWVYAKMTFADGTYYVPVTTSLPTAGDMDSIYVNGYDSINAYCGRIGVTTQMTVFQLTEEELGELKALDGWQELAESEVHLLRLLSEYLDQLNLSFESEGVQIAHSEVSAFAECVFDTEEGPAATMMDLQIMDRDAAGNYLVSATIVTGMTVGTEEDGRTDFMDETDWAVFGEIRNYYNLDSWYD